MHHSLKIAAPYYQAIREGKKTFEIRRNDRGYNAGDEVLLRPLDENGLFDDYKPCLEATIGYVTQYEQKENYVVFSLLNIREQPRNEGGE